MPEKKKKKHENRCHAGLSRGAALEEEFVQPDAASADWSTGGAPWPLQRRFADWSMAISGTD